MATEGTADVGGGNEMAGRGKEEELTSSRLASVDWRSLTGYSPPPADSSLIADRRPVPRVECLGLELEASITLRLGGETKA